MKRIYADLHLCPNLEDFKHVSQMVSKASRLGYGLIAMAFPSNLPEEEIWRLRNISKEAKMDLASRVDLKPKTPNELIYNLRRFRRKFEIIAVICESKNVARQAAKDRRVDLLNFPSLDFRWRFFDRAEAELASNGLACFEIDVKPLLTLEGSVRVRFLSNLRREVAIAKEFHVPVVLSSGVSDGMLLRKPRELAAFASLFDFDETLAIEAVSKNPVAIVKRNRDKLSSRFVAPGIRIIRRGKDC
jgi:RNase P/RNase MRP subunit p30